MKLHNLNESSKLFTAPIYNHMQAKRQAAAREVFLQEQRVEIIKVLQRYVPKQEDMQERQQAIDTIADELVAKIIQ